jgi:hypothetical protein
MSTEFCGKCKESHPGRLCDYNDQGECAETVDIAGAQAHPIEGDQLSKEQDAEGEAGVAPCAQVRAESRQVQVDQTRDSREGYRG